MKINIDVYNYAEKNAQLLKDIATDKETSLPPVADKKTDSFSKKPYEDYDKNAIELFLEEKRAALEVLSQKEQMESDLAASKSQIEGAMRMMDILIKCMKISMRIINGDRVPAQDEKLLLENYPEMYSSAKLLATRNEDSKEHDSLADEIEEAGEPEAPTDYSEQRSEINAAIGELEGALADIAAAEGVEVAI